MVLIHVTVPAVRDTLPYPFPHRLMAPTQAVATRQSSGSLDPVDQRREGQEKVSVVRAFAAHRGTLQKDEFYEPQKGVKAPTARALQKMANAQHISSEVVRIDWKNEESFRGAMCTAYVRAWIGTRMKPKQEQTEAVTMSMSAIIQKYIGKKLSERWKKDGPVPQWFKDKQWQESDVVLDEATGRMWPVSKKHQQEMLSFLSDQFAFLDRLAVTKAQARVFDKLLRPDAEIHYGDEGVEEYDPDHETTPTHAGSGTDTGTEPTPQDAPGRAAGPEDPGPPAKDPAAAPEDAAPPEVDDVFPPSAEDLDAHQERIEQQAKATQKTSTETVKKVELDERAQSLVSAIEAKQESKKSLDSLADSLQSAKKELPPEQYGEVMQTFWRFYQSAK